MYLDEKIVTNKVKSQVQNGAKFFYMVHESFFNLTKISRVLINKSFICSIVLKAFVMQLQEFTELSYGDQLKLIARSGRLTHSVIADDYQFTVYKVKGFYVELKRSIKELFFEKITAMELKSLPSQYTRTPHNQL
jgi:hypothetical protein